ncbi:GNAT family N-acetyltransferase [Halobaculum magnesiiphilum]|uniref:GNAT family N-acetyltransferase n=1 Tax=Halobaculum magnesiiphilum TaxID=1017351 RepID=A0A8T8W9X3_9EURY|nr:GNAT family N-acetyltransferase [Halobaculum magnesiiphilum]QZP36649.1 GNAT family N-acetyltransferase [Halobaculum magnesiiphilum]
MTGDDADSTVDSTADGSADNAGDSAAAASIRPARGDDADAVRRLLDAAMLSVPDDLADRVAAGDALVAVDADTAGETDDPAVIGALVLADSHIDAIAVRKRRRADGVGTALVAAAAERTDGSLTATFRPGVRPFYESLGFEIEAREGRLFGTFADAEDDAADTDASE